MRLSTILEFRFEITPDGKVWTPTAFDYKTWSSRLEVYDSVNVIARARPVAKTEASWKRVDGPGVTFTALPYFVGPLQYAFCRGKLKRAIRDSVALEDAVIYRVSSPLANISRDHLLKLGKPYGVEVVCDPNDAFAPGAFAHPLRALWRWIFTRELVHQCANASAAAYVTRTTLQKRYPVRESVFSTQFSDVRLPEAAFQTNPKRYEQSPNSPGIIMVAGLNRTYKGAAVLIEAISQLARRNLHCRLTFVGDGAIRPDLEAQASKLGLGDAVQFLGELPGGAEVFSQLDKHDLFVLPSFTEGLPRAMVEAMARGLPCVGTAVGGIPELLAEEDLVEPGDSDALSDKLHEVLTTPLRLSAMAERNLKNSRDFHLEVQAKKRVAFLEEVKSRTEQYLAQDHKNRQKYSTIGNLRLKE